MVRVEHAWRRLCSDVGQTMTEYAIALVLIAGILAAVLATTNLGQLFVDKIVSKLTGI
jgi:hypothetical protein